MRADQEAIIDLMNERQAFLDFAKSFVDACETHAPVDLMNEIGRQCKTAKELIEKYDQP